MTYRELKLAIASADCMAAEVRMDGDILLEKEYRRYANQLRARLDAARQRRVS